MPLTIIDRSMISSLNDCQLPMVNCRFEECCITQSAIGNRQLAMNSICNERAVCVRPAVAEELPRVAHFANLVEIEICDDQRVFVARRFCDKLPTRIAEVTLTVKLTDVPRLLVTDAIDRSDEIAIRNCVCRLFQAPEIFRQSGD